MTSNIQPTIRVFPAEYEGGSIATMTVTVTNNNPMSTALVRQGDWFQFRLDLPWGSTRITLAPTLIIHSPSRALKPNEFALTPSGPDGVRVVYIGVRTVFPPGEGFAFVLRFQAMGAPSFGMLAASSIEATTRMDVVAPAFTPVVFTQLRAPSRDANGEAASVGQVSGDVATLRGDVSTVRGNVSAVAGDVSTVRGDVATVQGNVSLIAGDVTGSVATVGGDVGTVKGGARAIGGNVDAVDGNVRVVHGTVANVTGTVNAGLGAVVNVARGAMVHSPDAAASAPPRASVNPMQVAALKWYDASGIEFRLGSPAAALIFDGHDLWAPLSGTTSIARIAPASGVITEIALSAPSGAALPLFSASVAMAYDGEKFWISWGESSMVVSPGGDAWPGGVAGCIPGAMVFDGTLMWHGTRAQVAGMLASDPLVARAQIPLARESDAQSLAFDGERVWCFTPNRLSIVQGSDEFGDAGVAREYALDYVPGATVFDGECVWVAERDAPALHRYSWRDAQSEPCQDMGTMHLKHTVRTLLYDGMHIFAGGDGAISTLRADTASLRRTIPVDSFITALSFDGAHVWAASSDGFLHKF